MALIAALAAEMDVRREVFSAAMARNLSAYNERVAPLGLEPLPLIVAIVDEVTDLSLLAGDAFMTPLTRLASKAASYGIILILATQNPKAKVLDTLIRGTCRCASPSAWPAAITRESSSDAPARTPAAHGSRPDDGSPGCRSDRAAGLLRARPVDRLPGRQIARVPRSTPRSSLTR